MAESRDLSSGRVVKTDEQGRKLAVIGTDTDSPWAAGFSYSLSWDEALSNAFAGVTPSIPNFDFTLWPTQYVLPEPGTASVLEVGFNYTPTQD